MHKWTLFEKAIILCLDKRKEHWQELLKQCEEYGIDAVPYICGDGSDPDLKYDQIDVINPDVSEWGYGVPGLKHHHYNAFLAHKGMIQKAKDNGWKSVLMMEDDTYILKRFTDVMTILDDNQPHPNSWLLFYLSWWQGNETDEFNTFIENEYKNTGNVAYKRVTENLGGFHSVVVKEELYDLILELPMNNPLDTQMCYMRKFIPSYMLLPKVTHIKSLYSFTEGVVFDRLKIE